MTRAAASRLRARVERGLEWVVIALMTALAVIVVVGVTFRKAGAALVWYDEVAAILLAWLTFYGAGLAALKRAHIGFPKLVGALAPPARAAALVVREVAVLAFFGLVAGAGARVVAALHGAYLVSLPSVSKQLAESAVPLGAVLFMAAEVLSALEWGTGPARDAQGDAR